MKAGVERRKTMTRQKKEIIKKIDEMERFIQADMELGCGFAPIGAYDSMYEEIHKLQEQLAELSHYNSVEEMLYDTRYQDAAYGKDEYIPFENYIPSSTRGDYSPSNPWDAPGMSIHDFI